MFYIYEGDTYRPDCCHLDMRSPGCTFVHPDVRENCGSWISLFTAPGACLDRGSKNCYPLQVVREMVAAGLQEFQDHFQAPVSVSAFNRDQVG